MKKKRRYYQHKLLMSYLAFMLVIVLFSTIYWGIQLSREQRSSLNNQLALMSQQGNTVIDSAFLQAKSTLYLHLENEMLAELLSRDTPPSAVEWRSLNYLVEGMLQQNTNLLSVYFVGSSGVVYGSEKMVLSDEEIETHIQMAAMRKGVPYIGLPYLQYIDQMPRRVLPVCKQLIDIGSGRAIGYVLVGFDFSALCREIDSTLIDGNYTLILSEDGDLLYRSNANYALIDEVYAQLQRGEWTQDDASSKYTYLRDSNAYVYGEQNKHTGWYMFKFCYGDQTASAFQQQVSLFIAFSIVWFVVIAVAANGVSKKLSRNVNLLRDAFNSTPRTSLEKVKTDGIANDEIGDLIISYNHMVDQLNDSIEKGYAATIRAQEMQIKMLNYQINPHFLYNCLNLISSLAIIREAYDISHVSRILGGMFHYSIEGGDIVSIRDEMNHLIDYLEIQKVRFPDLFTIDYDIDNALLDKQCMKFILQPIVENCFSHGFLPMTEARDRRMLIRIGTDGDDIVFAVTDNGTGIEPDRLDKIRTHLYSQEGSAVSSDNFIGLSNIHKRIEVFYGKPYGIIIGSEAGRYTRVTLRIASQSDKEKSP